MNNPILLAPHARGKAEEDIIFKISAVAGKRAAEIGGANVVNATIGALLDEEGRLITLPVVEEVIRSFEFADTAAYAPIAGLPGFIAAAEEAVFREYRPEAYLAGVATPGGTGAIHHFLWNYLGENEAFLTMDWFWDPYRSIARELLRRMETFNSFNEVGRFDLAACEAGLDRLATEQENVALLLNTPAHNPTGFTLSYEEWQALVAGLKERARKNKNNYVLFVDIAYLDFAPPGSRRFFELFTDMPANLLVLIGFSMSKSFALYGYRSGALLAVSSSQAVSEEFVKAAEFSNRGTWSNGTRVGMLALQKLVEDGELWRRLNEERDSERHRLAERAEIFLREASEAGLDICPYEAGYFVTAMTDKPFETIEILQRKEIFTVPLLQGGIRVALSAIGKNKVPGLAGEIKKAIEEAKK